MKILALPLLLLLLNPTPSLAVTPLAIQRAAVKYCQNRQRGWNQQDSIWNAYLYIYDMGHRVPQHHSDWFKAQVVSRIVQVCSHTI